MQMSSSGEMPVNMILIVFLPLIRLTNWGLCKMAAIEDDISQSHIPERIYLYFDSYFTDICQ